MAAAAPAAAPKLMSEKQDAFIWKLMDEREVAERDRLVKTLRIAEDPEEPSITSNQASRIIEWLLAQPRKELNQAQTGDAWWKDLPEVAEGRYAVEMDGKLHFFKVRRPDEGKWAGYTFVDEQAGPQEYPVKGPRTRVVLALIAEAPTEALIRYGHELGRCGVCGLELTDEDSRARGIGPVCASKLG